MIIRYVIALTVAVLIIAGGTAFVQSTYKRQRDLVEKFKRELREKKQAGQLPAEWKDADIDNLSLNDFGLPLPQSEMIRWDTAMFLGELWYVFAPVIVVVCLGLAALSGIIWKGRG